MLNKITKFFRILTISLIVLTTILGYASDIMHKYDTEKQLNQEKNNTVNNESDFNKILENISYSNYIEDTFKNNSVKLLEV